MSKKAKTEPKSGAGSRKAKHSKPEWFDIVNWDKAQPRMKRDGPNAWMKLYTSLLMHDVFASLDTSSQILLVGLWLLAAQMGRSVLPNDPEWLRRHIPFLKKKPSLKPLLEAKDMYGRVKPFLRFCAAPRADETDTEANDPPVAGNGHPEIPNKKTPAGTAVATRAPGRSRVRSRKSRAETELEKKRRDKSRGKPQSGRKVVTSAQTKTGSGKVKQEQCSAEKTQPDETTLPAQQSTAGESPDPIDPTKPDAVGKAAVRISSASPGSDPPTVGEILSARRHRYDGEAQTFSQAICEILEVADDPSERGSLASQWLKLCGDLPPPVKRQIKAKAIHHAIEVRKNRKCRNRRAVWMTKFQGLSKKYRAAEKGTKKR